MLERSDRQVRTRQPGDLRRPLAGGVDDDPCPDVALRGRERPGAAAALEGRHRRVPEDPFTGACDERPRETARVDVPVRRQVRRREHVADLDQRVQLAGALRPDDLDRDVEKLGRGGAMAKLVDAIRRRRQPHAAALVVIGGERLVELDAVTEQAREVVARVELRAETGRVPGRAARQLVLLEQDDVLPSEPAKVVEQAAAGHAAPDDRDPGIREHVWDDRVSQSEEVR